MYGKYCVRLACCVGVRLKFELVHTHNFSACHASNGNSQSERAPEDEQIIFSKVSHVRFLPKLFQYIQIILVDSGILFVTAAFPRKSNLNGPAFTFE